MIHLCYANQTEALLQALSERLATARAQPGASLFQPTHLVVPNRNVETYVKLGLARALGVAANIQTRLLRGFLAEVVRANVPGGEVEIIDRLHIQGELLGLLQDERFCAARELAPVRDYLLAAGTAPDAVDLRRFQLSAQLAALFDDYPFSRPEMLHAWREGKLAEGPEPTLQRWQRELWLGIFGRGGTLPTRERRDGRRRLTLAGLFDEPPAEALRLPPAVHIFGISYVARLYKRIFAALAQATDLHIYTLNPCREFWEDLETGARRRRARLPSDRRKFPPRRSPEQLALGAVDAGPGEAPFDENPLLTLWGRPGRDNIKLLNQLSDCDFEARFADPIDDAPATVLRQLQHDILDRIPARTGSERLALTDDSVTVFACPDPRRELETIAAEIWRLMRETPGQAGGGGTGEPLRFNDVAVLVPGADAAARLSLASAVFREASELPHSVVDLPLPADSRIAEAIELLLGLPLGPMGREDLLRLVMHPAVSGRFPAVDPGRWPALCEQLEIVHGADHQDHAGTYIDRDVFNWDQGLRRLALGAVLSGERSGDERIFATASGQYLPAELAPDAQADATRFTLLVRSLLADARRARTPRLTLPEWMAFLRGTITQAITPQGPDDQSALLRCLAELQPLEEIGPPDLAVGYRVACELVRAALATLAARRGQYLADGVTVSSFLPMRAVPFKVIFIAGLGEGEFPAGERPTPLDLRARAPRPGDVSPREADQYMFLEALLCARQRLYCSYVASDPLTGEAHAPSSVLQDLLGALRGGYWAPGAEAAVTRRPPLRRHEDADVRAFFPAAAREQQAVALGDDLKRRLPAGGAIELSEVRRLLPAPIWREASAALGWLAPPAALDLSAGESAPATETPSLSLSTMQLRRFLECPLQGSTGVLLRLYQGDDEVEAATRDNEDFEPRAGAVDRLLRQVFQQALRTASVDPAADAVALGQAYAAQIERQTLDGTLPLGAFGAAAQRRHQRTLAIWLEELRRLTGERRPELGRVFFGHADEHEAAPHILPAVTLEVPLQAGAVTGASSGVAAGPPRTVRVSIHGRSEVLAERDGQRLILLLAPNGQKAELPREQLSFVRAFIDHVVLSASDEASPRASRALLCRRTSAKSAPSEITFQPLARDEARGYLRDLIGDLLSGVHPYLLPWEAIHSWRAKTPSPPVPDVVTMLRDDNWTKFRSDYGPLSRAHARSFPPPTDQMARAMIARRFGLFFERRVKAAGAEPGGPPAEGE